VCTNLNGAESEDFVAAIEKVGGVADLLEQKIVGNGDSSQPDAPC
jgi:hypothetical protein